MKKFTGKPLDLAGDFAFDPENQDYLIHITTSTHVAQICLFLLTEARHLPGKRLQTQARNLSDAGRSLFSASRARRSSTNDADWLRKYLARFGLG